MTTTLVDLIRHGEPEGGSRYRGNSIDDPLSEKGWSQMWTAIGENPPWDIIVSSPVLRCSDFAQALSDKINKPVFFDDQFREVGFGSWEGKSKTQLKQTNQEEFDAFYSDPVNNRPSGAESLNDFIARVTGSYDNVVKTHAGQRILIVAHAGVIRAIVARTLQASSAGLYRINVDNASISRISHRHNEHNENSAVVEFINGKSIADPE